MPSIGPELPPHLQQRQQNSIEEEDAQIGPQVPPGLSPQASAANDDDNDDDEGYVPELPPDLAAARSGSSSKTEVPKNSVTSSSVPSRSDPARATLLPNPTYPNYGDDDDDDDDVGPKPLPVGMKRMEKSAVEEFLEREERRRKAAQEAAAPKKLKRDEWMLVPPSASELLGNIDPTKAKARQFSRSTHASSTSNKKTDTSLWTETPAERQQRLADEITGKKRRVTDVSEVDETVTGDEKRRRREEEAVRRGVDEYTAKVRGPSLLVQHSTSGKAESSAMDEKEGGIWDHSRDMSLGGRLMDDSKRKKLIHEAHGLSDRFGVGKGGSFM